MSKIADRAVGHWRSILQAYGLNDRTLSNKHGPCPVCGGKDRFRFDDKDGKGTFFCNHCGPGDGFDLLMALKGCDFYEAAQFVESVIGRDAEPRPAQSDGKDKSPTEKVSDVRKLWREAKRIVPGDPAHTYLTERVGDFEPSRALRFHPETPAGEDNPKRYLALLSAYVDPLGDLAGLQRTYLTPDGHKVDWSMPRLTMGLLPDGGAVRLHPPGKVLGIAEGVETALSAKAIFSIPVWAALNEGRLQVWQPPEGVKEVWIFADKDVTHVGQFAAHALAKRLHRDGYAVQVLEPWNMGDDWNDDLRRQRA